MLVGPMYCHIFNQGVAAWNSCCLPCRQTPAWSLAAGHKPLTLRRHDAWSTLEVALLASVKSPLPASSAELDPEASRYAAVHSS